MTPKKCFTEFRKKKFKKGWLKSKRINLDEYGDYLVEQKMKNNRE